LQTQEQDRYIPPPTATPRKRSRLKYAVVDSNLGSAYEAIANIVRLDDHSGGVLAPPAVAETYPEPTLEIVDAGFNSATTATIDLDITSNPKNIAGLGYVRYCYYTEDPAYAEQATNLKWQGSDGNTYTEVVWDGINADIDADVTLQFTLHPPTGVTVGGIVSAQAICGVRYVYEVRNVKTYRRTTIDKNGTQESSKSWQALSPGGNCNYSGLSGELLVSCLYARSTVVYTFHSREKRFVDGGINRSAGLFACHTSVRFDTSHHGHVAKLYAITSSANGFAQCWLERAWVKAKWVKRNEKAFWKTVDLTATWLTTTTSSVARVADGVTRQGVR
jgi:hypothetical protein